MPGSDTKRVAFVIALLVILTIGSIVLLSLFTRAPQAAEIQAEITHHDTELLFSMELPIVGAVLGDGAIYFAYTTIARESAGIEGVLDAFAEQQREFESAFTEEDYEYERILEGVFDLMQRATIVTGTLTVNRIELDGTLTTVLELCSEANVWAYETLGRRRLLSLALTEKRHFQFLSQAQDGDTSLLFYTEMRQTGEVLFHHTYVIEDRHLLGRFVFTEEGEFLIQVKRFAPSFGSYLYFFDQDGALRTTLTTGEGYLIKTRDGDIVFASDVVTRVNVAEGTLGEVISDTGLPRNVIVYDTDQSPDAPFDLYFRRGSNVYGFCANSGEQTKLFNRYGAGLEGRFRDKAMLFLPDRRMAVFHSGPDDVTLWNTELTLIGH